MLEKAVTKRVQDFLAEFEDATQWDFDLLRQELLMHYLLVVPELESDDRPVTADGVTAAALAAASRAFDAKEVSLDEVKDESGAGFSGRLLSLVMLNVLDDATLHLEEFRIVSLDSGNDLIAEFEQKARGGKMGR